MENLLAVAYYTIKQHIRHRVYFTVILFSVIILGAGVVISALAVEERTRMVLNVGLAGIEFLALVSVLFIAVNIILEEMENRTIYLILSHPIERWHYIVGRYVGTIAALASGMVLMALFHMGVLFLYGWTLTFSYLVAVTCSILKIAVVGALAVLISLITTSTASSMTLTGFLWVLGHFIDEMKFMAEKSLNPLVKAAAEFLGYITPNFNYFNYRDFWNAPTAPPASWFTWMACYTVAYIGISLFLTSWLFSKKEF